MSDKKKLQIQTGKVKPPPPKPIEKKGKIKPPPPKK